MNKFARHFLVFGCVCTFVISSALGAAQGTHESKLPLGWHVLPEDAPSGSFAILDAAELSDTERKGAQQGVEQIFRASGKVMDQVSKETKSVTPPVDAPADWVPWHLKYFTTDLSVSTSGVVGVLVMKGTPSVQAYWRKKEPAPSVAQATEQPVEPSHSASGLSITSETSEKEVRQQVDAMVRVALASGEVKDEGIFRKSLSEMIQNFRAMTAAVEAQTEGAWFVSGLRLDISVDASGRAKFGTVGGDLRLRLEWKRIQRSLAAGVGSPTRVESKFSSELLKLVMAIREDLEMTFADGSFLPDFEANSYRVGLGISAKGDVGVVKGAATLLGHVNFSRAPGKKPVVTGKAVADLIRVIEGSPAPSHLKHASQLGVAYETLGVGALDSPAEVVYRLSRERFRDGLLQAKKIATFFAETGKVAESIHWKLHQMKVGLDLSVGGDVGMVGLSGLASTEVTMTNKNF